MEKVSLIITTKNEAKNIEKCLESIQCQTYSNIEIIVVDNKSEDKTKEIAKRYTKKVYNKGPERSAQRNYGMIEKSSGKYVMFIDADMVLSPRLVENCVKKIKEEKVNALHIPEIILGKKFFSKVRRFERQFYNGTIIDGARFFVKKDFVKVKGFDETMSGPEDWDIDKKIKQRGKIELLNKNENYPNWKLKEWIMKRGVKPRDFSAIYHNESEFDLRKYLSKKGYYSRSFKIYSEKWKNDEEVKKQLGMSYRFFGVFLENGKWKRLIMHPVLTFGMYYLRFLVGVTYIINKNEI